MTTKRKDEGRPVILAAVQDSPVAFDLDASIAKLHVLTRQAVSEARSAHGDDADILVVFPEAFLSCYPRGLDFGAKVGSRTTEGRTWFRRYHQSSVPVANVEGTHMTAIRAAASENRVTLVVGVIERCDEPASGPSRASYGSEHAGGHGTLYCTALTISPEGNLLVAHRKLMPTGTERLVWGQGDGAGLRVADTPVGRVGAVICWENLMPQLRISMYAKGIELYAAPTADCRDSWAPVMQTIAQEGRCFVISCCQFTEKRDLPNDYPAYEDAADDHVITRGGSLIVDPLGQILAGPLFDRRGILTTRVDLHSILEAKMDFDSAGHYARPDVFKLVVDEQSKQAVM